MSHASRPFVPSPSLIQFLRTQAQGTTCQPFQRCNLHGQALARARTMRACSGARSGLRAATRQGGRNDRMRQLDMSPKGHGNPPLGPRFFHAKVLEPRKEKPLLKVQGPKAPSRLLPSPLPGISSHFSTSGPNRRGSQSRPGEPPPPRKPTFRERLWGMVSRQRIKKFEVEELSEFCEERIAPASLSNRHAILAKAALEPRLRCTEVDENGEPTTTDGEFNKTELIAKVLISSYLCYETIIVANLELLSCSTVFCLATFERSTPRACPISSFDRRLSFLTFYTSKS